MSQFWKLFVFICIVKIVEPCNLNDVAQCNAEMQKDPSAEICSKLKVQKDCLNKVEGCEQKYMDISFNLGVKLAEIVVKQPIECPDVIAKDAPMANCKPDEISRCMKNNEGAIAEMTKLALQQDYDVQVICTGFQDYEKCLNDNSNCDKDFLEWENKKTSESFSMLGEKFKDCFQVEQTCSQKDIATCSVFIMTEPNTCKVLDDVQKCFEGKENCKKFNDQGPVYKKIAKCTGGDSRASCNIADVTECTIGFFTQITKAIQEGAGKNPEEKKAILKTLCSKSEDFKKCWVDKSKCEKDFLDSQSELIAGLFKAADVTCAVTDCSQRTCSQEDITTCSKPIMMKSDTCEVLDDVQKCFEGKECCTKFNDQGTVYKKIANCSGGESRASCKIADVKECTGGFFNEIIKAIQESVGKNPDEKKAILKTLCSKSDDFKKCWVDKSKCEKDFLDSQSELIAGLFKAADVTCAGTSTLVSVGLIFFSLFFNAFKLF